MTNNLHERWDEFLGAFFGTGNRLEWPSDNETVVAFVEANALNIDRDSPGPFVLPRVTDTCTTYYAIALDDDQAHELRRLLAGVVGPTYTTFDGRSAVPDLGDQVLQAAIRFAGSPHRVYGFEVIGGGGGPRKAVRQQVLILLDLVRQRPRRRVATARPIGRLLRDFERALDNRDVDSAEALLFGPIAATGRLSNMNRLFLHVRLLAALDRWDELNRLPSLDDLLRIARPAPVSDALAHLALRFLAESTRPGTTQFEVFDHSVAPRFGAIVPSVEHIRSEAGACYYTLWLLRQGEGVNAVKGRLAGLAWGESPEVLKLLADSGESEPAPLEEPHLNMITEAVVAGRYETAIDLLSQLRPSAESLPVLILAVNKTLSIAALELVARFRQTLGDDAVDAVVTRLQRESPTGRPIDFAEPTRWPERICLVGAGDLPVWEALSALDESGLTELARDPQALRDLADAVHTASSTSASGPVLEVAVEMLRRLQDLLPERDGPRLRPLRLAVIQLWCLVDDSGDLTLASDVIDEVELLLLTGCSTEEYEDLVELLTMRWDPFLTDIAFSLGVRTLEVLAVAQPGTTSVLGKFATPLLARVSAGNADRLDLADLLLADALSAELSLGLSLTPLREVAEEDASLVGWTGTIGIYSLDENALRRAARILSERLPTARIRTAHDKVSTESLRSLAETADLMVVATQKAKHAATDAIRAARIGGALTYPKGKGTSSIVRATIDALHNCLESAVTAGTG